MVVYGRDHPTPDGTAVRDFVHVSDLAAAHLLALDHLRAGGGTEQINLGNGHGVSVLEVIEIARRVTVRPIPSRFDAARPAIRRAWWRTPRRRRHCWGWKPALPDLGSIVESAWAWH